MKTTRSLNYITVATNHDIMASRVAAELFAAEGAMSDVISSKEFWMDVNCQTGPISQCTPNKDASRKIENIVEENETIKTHVHDLLNVYYDIGTCGVSGQCQAATICRAFYPEISAFYTKYYGHLKSFDDKWNIGKITQIGRFLDFCEPYMG